MGLSDKIKDEFMSIDRPNELNDMIELCNKIDNHYIERTLERKH
jgi:hypothetical protein